ncbi:MAG: elongation factor P maturation arginine rhamnosyltransferase EarP [Pseudomonadota bacterium]
MGAPAALPALGALHWALFCRVVDNHGDLGVAWRLARQLAAAGDTVTLWVDVPDALAWMAPGATEGAFAGIRVRRWTTPFAPDALDGGRADVWVELFGGDIDPEFIAQHDRMALGNGGTSSKEPVWINLEYLSAEGYVERSHGLPSPILHGPGRGRTRHFFYPGFTPRTGGLLREADLLARQAGFDAAAWRARWGWPAAQAPVISLFCYEPPALGRWLDTLAAGRGLPGESAVQLLVTHGRAAAAVQRHFGHENLPSPAATGEGALQISYLPALTQPDYDHLLWASDLNFVRGEDSFVRALWAGKPFVWHIYPQDDGAHAAKLEAFLDWLDAPPDLRAFHRIWNGLATGALPAPDLAGWGACVQRARARLLAQEDLLTQLRRFVRLRVTEKG